MSRKELFNIHLEWLRVQLLELYSLHLEPLLVLLATVELRGARGATIEGFDLLRGLLKLDLSTECTGCVRSLGSVKKQDRLPSVLMDSWSVVWTVALV